MTRNVDFVSVKSNRERTGVDQAGDQVQFLAYQSEEAMKALGHNYRPGRPEMAFDQTFRRSARRPRRLSPVPS